MPSQTTTQPDPIGDRLDELAELGKCYSLVRAAGKQPEATRRAMLRLVGEIHEMAWQATLNPSADA